MEDLFKIGFIVINLVFLVVYLINFVIALVRDIKSKNKFKTNEYLTVDGTVIDIQETKKIVSVLIEFTGPNNLILFSQTFDFTPEEFKKNPYELGQKVKLAYNDISKQKKIHLFPILIEGSKPKLDKGPIFANLALVFVAGYFSINILINTFKDYSKPFDEMFSSTYVFIVLVIYLVLLSYLVESLFGIPRSENQNYLKMHGHTTKARVVTFKLAGSKNARGYKESRMTIEYRNHLGELTQTSLASYLYTETQEEYIDIVYDPKNAKNVVYLRK
ncbi:MAG: hypothetical protein IJX78_06460 [Bacilli bacterium]|nr:hypothetical protein [Bacilli bacterium]